MGPPTRGARRRRTLATASVTGGHSTQRRRTRTRAVPVTHTVPPWVTTLPPPTSQLMTMERPSLPWQHTGPRSLATALLLEAATACARTGGHSTLRRKRRTRTATAYVTPGT